MPQQLPQHKSLIFCLFPLLFVYSNFAVKKRRMGKTSFYMKRLLPLAFVMSAVTGIGLHIAGHGTDYEAWHIWSVAHAAASLLWLASVSFHVKRHRYWYKSLRQKKQDNPFLVGNFPDSNGYGYHAAGVCKRGELRYRAVALPTGHSADGTFTGSRRPPEMIRRNGWYITQAFSRLN